MFDHIDYLSSFAATGVFLADKTHTQGTSIAAGRVLTFGVRWKRNQKIMPISFVAESLRAMRRKTRRNNILAPRHGFRRRWKKANERARAHLSHRSPGLNSTDNARSPDGSLGRSRRDVCADLSRGASKGEEEEEGKSARERTGGTRSLDQLDLN